MKKPLITLGLISLLTGLVLSAASNASSAEQAMESTNDRWRDRFVFGVDALGGHPINNDCSDCYWNVGAGASFQVGWMLSPRLALLMDTHGVAVGHSEIKGFDEENNFLVQGVVAFGLQYWTHERFWIKGGIGQGQVRASATVESSKGPVDIIETETGFGTLAAVGYEFYQGRKIGLNLHARYAGIHSDGLNRAGLVLGVGFAWYP